MADAHAVDNVAGAVVDGQFVPFDAATGVDTAFAEISELASGCRFDDCSHANEPGCAVREALEAGDLDPDRYAAYLALRRESTYHAAQSDARLRANETKKWKTIAKDSRAFFRRAPLEFER